MKILYKHSQLKGIKKYFQNDPKVLCSSNLCSSLTNKTHKKSIKNEIEQAINAS